MGKLTISMAIFNSFFYVYQAGVNPIKTILLDINSIKLTIFLPPLSHDFTPPGRGKILGHGHPMAIPR